MSDSEIKKQVEYYLSDANLSKDEFFRSQIAANKNGYLNFDSILKCNKVKKLGVLKPEQLAKACENSKLVEVNKDGLSVRRAGNKKLPEQTGTIRKRDAKAEEKKKTNGAKEEEKKDETPEKVERNADG